MQNLRGESNGFNRLVLFSNEIFQLHPDSPQRLRPGKTSFLPRIRLCTRSFHHDLTIYNFLYLVYITCWGKKEVLMCWVYKNLTGSIISKSFLIALHKHYYRVKYFQSETCFFINFEYIHYNISTYIYYIKNIKLLFASGITLSFEIFTS